MTLPMTTEMDVERLRMNPNVAVAVAISPLGTIVCNAMSGDWKLGPTPMPAMIWKMMILAQPWPSGRSSRRPKPSVIMARPNQIAGR